MKRVLIIGNPSIGQSTESFLFKFIKIIKANTKSISVISGDMVQDNDILWIKPQYILGKSRKVINILYYLLSQLQTVIEMSKILREIDVIIVLPTPFILPILYSKMKNKRTIIFAAQKSNKIYLRIIERICFIFSDIIIIESYNVINELNLNEFKDKIVKGNIYVDVDFFKNNNNINDRKNIVGYIGTLNKRKGVDNLIDAMLDMIKNYDIEFLIGGTGPFENIIKDLSNKNDKVNFLHIPQKDLPNYLNRLKLLVLPSCTEGVPNIILEAMACGTPVLATPVGGIPDIIKDNVTGFIMEDNSKECIMDNIIRALTYPNLSSITINATELIEKEFTYEWAVQRYGNILKKV